MIIAKNLKKSFEGKSALEGVNMRVGEGSVYGLVGPNGAGKTTLIQLLNGVYRPEEGDVRIDGEAVYENPAAKRRIATISDDPYYSAHSDLREMHALYRGLYPRFDEDRYRKLGDIFSFGESKLLRKMSKGMRKQAAFWLTMCTGCDVILLDEPVDGLDPVMRRQIWSILLGDVADRGVTVLVSSHNLRELEDVCDHVGILSEGRLLLDKSLDELQDNFCKLQFAFEGDMPPLPENLKPQRLSHVGRVYTAIFRGNREEILPALAAENPLLLEAVPLTLEEIFLFELEEENYAVKDIL